MNQELAIATKQAAELSETAALLSEKLNSLATEVQFQNTSTVDPFIFAITIFSLACFVGYYVVWRVTPALHSPLMGVTNAISSVIIVGALLALGPVEVEGLPRLLAFVAVVLASINIFGGFVVTQRMLSMFRKKDK